IKLINVTVANNTAAQGGGIYNDGDGDNVGTINDEVFLQNSIVANNIAAVSANCASGKASEEGTNYIVFPTIADCQNAQADSGNPNLGAPELTFSFPNIVTYTLPLGASSAALGAGDANVCNNFPILSIDQRGFPRPQGDQVCDAGAYESSEVG